MSSANPPAGAGASDDAAAGSERTLAPGVDQLALEAPTLPPYTTTWTTLIRSGTRALLIDPGFGTADDAGRLLAWARARGARDIDRILLTHGHRDHVAGLPALLDLLPSVSVLGHPAEAPRLPSSVALVPLTDGRRLVLGGALLTVHHTPGHAPGHLVFGVTPAAEPSDAPGRTGVVAGDLLVGRNAPWIGVPDGDVDAYLGSVERIRALSPAWLATSHGAAPDDPDSALAGAAAHRRARLDAVAAALDRPRTLNELVDAVYGTPDETARPRLRASMLAQLRSLMRARRAWHVGSDEEGPFSRTPGGREASDAD